MTNNVRFFEQTNELTGEVTEHVIITNSDGSFTGMTKEHYDKHQAEQSTPMVTDASKS
jgi:ERCC4-type nuclease